MKLTQQQFDVIWARTSWPHSQDVRALRGHIAALDAEIERLREALRQVERLHDTSDICNDAGLSKWCDICGCFFDQRHADHCPFKILET